MKEYFLFIFNSLSCESRFKVSNDVALAAYTFFKKIIYKS